ncbi:uncharacterized protein LOC126377028 isoform X1 [Pectinophora gossypiella]|uniref:uncharacterized protein LOC126377028 isoform X1 n=1 Tax=Pectinophora gossypiella TaxID=13191 RepID=UPI00214F3275|nr:uncharacterized protein LOC126377028 isoform X1 [Pectinophora gossypiella]
MDYAVGSVAALISGNVTPNRPKLIKKALTPMKHQPSPNVTPKSELVDDRSIFLSPSLQKKKAIVKKSPKRIFENPDLDVTNDSEGNSSLPSPHADKVKKHLKEDLEADNMAKTGPESQKSPKKGKGKLNKSVEPGTPKKNKKVNQFNEGDEPVDSVQIVNESTPTKKKKQKTSISVSVDEEKSDKENSNKNSATSLDFTATGRNKKKRKSSNVTEEVSQNGESVAEDERGGSPKKQKKTDPEENQNQETLVTENQGKSKKKNKKNKKKNNKPQNNETSAGTETVDENESMNQAVPKKKKNKNKGVVNPNAITNQDSDSEHESDNEIESDTEQTNKEILDTGPVEDSSDEEEEKTKAEKEENKEKREVNSAEVKRTLFVGNVPFSNKCKKEIKKIFSKYGQIETVRIRTIPVKDARVTPKLAVIKNELHPERSTVHVYVKFKDEESVDKALAENNTVLNAHHLRVTRSDSTGAEHDPRSAVFVGNLPFAIEDDVLRRKFEKCGDIESVRIVRDKKTNAGKGFGYVNFLSKDSVELALSMTEEDLTIKNRILRVNRCTMGNQKRDQGKPGRQGNPGKFQGRPGNSGRFQGRPGNSGKFQGRPGNSGKFQGRPGNSGTFQGRPDNAGKFQGRPGNPGRFQGKPDRFQGRQGKQEESDGAYRRIMNKRQNEESAAGPPNKRPNTAQPNKEKKPRKEFVGMTSEKKKKHKFDKGSKKKKALSEILTKFN